MISVEHVEEGSAYQPLGLLPVRSSRCVSCCDNQEIAIKLSELLDIDHDKFGDRDVFDAVVHVDIEHSAVDAIVPGSDRYSYISMHMHDVCIGTNRLRISGYVGKDGHLALLLASLPCVSEFDLCSAHPITNRFCDQLMKSGINLERLCVNCSQFDGYTHVDSLGDVIPCKSITSQGILRLMGVGTDSDTHHNLQELYLYNCTWMNLAHLQRIGTNIGQVQMVCIEGLSKDTENKFVFDDNKIEVKDLVYANLYPVVSGEDEWNVAVFLTKAKDECLVTGEVTMRSDMGPVLRMGERFRQSGSRFSAQPRDDLETSEVLSYFRLASENRAVDAELSAMAASSLHVEGEYAVIEIEEPDDDDDDALASAPLTDSEFQSRLTAACHSPVAFFAVLQLRWHLTS